MNCTSEKWKSTQIARRPVPTTVNSQQSKETVGTKTVSSQWARQETDKAVQPQSIMSVNKIHFHSRSLQKSR